MARAEAATAIACLCLAVLAGCGGTTQAPVTRPSPARVTGPDPIAALSRPIQRRLEAAGYAVYRPGLLDPAPASAFYVEVDWATRHAFRFWVYPFPSDQEAAAFFDRARQSQRRFARSFRAARDGRVVYLGSTQQEFFGGKGETEALPASDFSATVKLAEGRS